MSKYSVIDKIFVGILAFFLLLPILRIKHDEKSITENRMLATRPTFILQNKINNKYGIEYDKWFSDRFFGRDVLINLYGWRGGTNGSLGVLVEQDNWLFYKGENSLRNFANLDVLSDTQLKQMGDYINNLDKWCKKHNKKFIFFIAPDKNKIYGEHVTKIIKKHPDSQSRSIQLIEYLKKNTNATVIYPYDALIANKSNGFLYFKNDTHWNDLGAYVGYTEIMKALDINPITYKTSTYKTRPRGDLTNMAPGISTDTKTTYASPNIINTAVCDKISNNRSDTKCVNKKAKHKKSLFALRDSFFNSLERYYANTFVEVNTRWRYNILPEDLEFITNNADIVILEIIERNLDALNHSFPKD